jgi:hypothetical protein
VILVPVGWQHLVGTKSIFESHPYAGVAAIKKVFEPCNSVQRVPLGSNISGDICWID